MTVAEKKKKFSKVLFRWHKSHYRPMEWRNTHDPYRILISEIMLQQTQVKRVGEKYAVFLKKFPTVQALASASLGDVLRVWTGLGYNRRAKYLHECAKVVVSLYGGKFSSERSALLELPGIGLSTAAALRAFAFAKDDPMIDTNIRRILVRVFFRGKNVPRDKELYLFARSLIPKGKGRAWNYAMLDLGATFCTARGHSDDCPMGKLHGRVSDFVYKKPQKKFAHSDRYYRGRILAKLVVGQCTRAKLLKELGLEKSKFETLLSMLLHEKLIITDRTSLRLP